jgi:hypothetical protein
MNLYDATVPVFSKFLRNLDRWFDKAIAHAEAKKFDPEILVSARLAPDQYPLSGQVQTTCDAAKFCVAKLTGKEAPSNPDTEKTIAELRARIRTCIAYLETFKRDDFAGAEERACSHSWMQGKSLRGGDYLDHWALPNFHFHLTIAYEIFRHNGVPLGIEDHTGELPFRS